ncbi:hypothetical protein AURDEDRAFT_171549 [Auricularia subglabra TFB-10046 SS5]|nr:hypothetical protein AURDEDRAFT_171549 [Auricularia subglabra TFB-10046 SS5]
MPSFVLDQATALNAELLGLWNRGKDGDVFVVGVTTQICPPSTSAAPETHEFRAVFFAETLGEARVMLLTWKFFAQEHKIPFFLPVKSVSLARNGSVGYVEVLERDEVEKWVVGHGRWKGRAGEWCRQRTSAYWCAP